MNRRFMSVAVFVMAVILGLVAAWGQTVPQDFSGELAFGGCGSPCRGVKTPDCDYEGSRDDCRDEYAECYGSTETRTCDEGVGPESCTNQDCTATWWDDDCS